MKGTAPKSPVSYWAALLIAAVMITTVLPSPVRSLEPREKEFFSAVCSGKVDRVKAMIAEGIDVNMKDRGMTPIFTAKPPEIVKILIEAGAYVNAKSKKSGRNKGGATAIDVAKAGGDKEIIKTLEEAGAKEEAKEEEKRGTEIKKAGTYPPGEYTGPCSYEIHDTTRKGTKPGDTDYSYTVISSLTLKGGGTGYFVPRKWVSTGVCGFELHTPGEYTLHTTKLRIDWVWVCSGTKDTIDPKCRYVSKREKSKMTEEKIVFRIAALKEKKKEKPDKEEPSIAIEMLIKGDQFTFNAAGKGKLEIEAVATVSPEKYEGQVTWKIDGIKGSTKKIDPPKGSKVKIIFEGLPRDNKEFGEKKITASVAGKSDPITIEVFFPPDAKNHPGKGRGETPNWFYYWMQTKAGKGYSPRYKPVSDCGSGILGNYFYDEDAIYLYDNVYNNSCRSRPGAAKSTTGLDCFGETLRHETVHKEELRYWWDSVITSIGTFKLPPPGCGLSDVPGNIAKQLIGIDFDRDMVPDYIEKGLAGCDPNNSRSCPKRPFNDVPDVEMNAYRISWKKWPLGTADEEDWSWCGKQWSDPSVCPGEKIW